MVFDGVHGDAASQVRVHGADDGSRCDRLASGL